MIKNNKKYIFFVLNDVAPTKDVFASKMFLPFLVALLADITKKKKKKTSLCIYSHVKTTSLTRNDPSVGWKLISGY